jgi:hypothetical protein
MDPILQLAIILVCGALGTVIIINEVPRNVIKAKRKSKVKSK